MSANAATIGKYEDTMDVGFDAKELEISFNGKMLSELVGQFTSAKMGAEAGEDEDDEEKAPAKSESLCIKFLDATSPLLMHAEGGEKSLVYVLMPLRT